MKSLKFLLLFFSLIIFSSDAFSQFDIGKKIKKKVERKIEKEVDNTIDKGIEETEEAIKKDGKEEEEESEKSSGKKSKNNSGKNSENNSGSDELSGNNTTQEEIKIWSKYDFVSGDVVIFEDNLVNEKHGEFPSKWDLLGGNSEIAKFGDDNVIAFMKSKTEITPLMKTKEYLPEVFTIEFDIYYYNKYNEAYYLGLKDAMRIDIRTNKVSSGNFVGEPDKSSGEAGWHHIALSFNKRALKLYFDQKRVLNIPNVEKKPVSMSVSALSHGVNKGDPAMIRNIRIAEGGVELYDRLKTDGKIVTRGILFDVGKSTIKPESMGIINEIVKLMNEHADIKFSVEGHTDSDGEEPFNQKLSDDRSSAVVNLLAELGIDKSRLESKGWGESKPVNGNSSPEEKANNRRVEFVRI